MPNPKFADGGFIDAKRLLINNTYTIPQIWLCTKNLPR